MTTTTVREIPGAAARDDAAVAAATHRGTMARAVAGAGVTSAALARRAAAFGAGLLFALGLGLSGMTQPAKVVGFLDVTGAWDPSLAFVMGGAVLVTLAGFRLAQRRGAPRFDARFHLPTQRAIDARLVLGAAVFGVGWGLSGYCPGPALMSVVTGARGALVFVAAMLAGFALVRWGEPLARRGNATRND